MKDGGSQTQYQRRLLHVPKALHATELIISAQEKCIEVNLISLPQVLHSAVCPQSFTSTHPLPPITASHEIKAAKP